MLVIPCLLVMAHLIMLCLLNPTHVVQTNNNIIGGCSYCAAGQFPVGNPSASIEIPPDFLSQAPPGKFCFVAMLSRWLLADQP
jgi:hypothetical protein